jgi:hypothetical protein
LETPVRRGPALAALSSFLVGLILGCGSKATDASGGAGDPAPRATDPPKPVTKDTLQDAKERLSEMEKAITAKKKELANLEGAADALRKEITDTEVPKDKAPKEKVYKTATELFADLPKDKYPKAGKEFGIERAAARKWAKDTLPGRRVELSAGIIDVSVGGDGPFKVEVTLDGWYAPGLGYAFGDAFKLGDQPCYVILTQSRQEAGGITGLNILHYPSCTDVDAKALRALKGKSVSLCAKITAASLSDGSFGNYETLYFTTHRRHLNGADLTERKGLAFELVWTAPAINDLMPSK